MMGENSRGVTGGEKGRAASENRQEGPYEEVKNQILGKRKTYWGSKKRWERRGARSQRGRGKEDN